MNARRAPPFPAHRLRLSAFAVSLLVVAGAWQGCGDDDDGLSDSDLEEALLDVGDLDGGWGGGGVVNPPADDPAHFTCLPTSISTVVSGAISVEFSRRLDDPEAINEPNLSQYIVAYERGALEAMASAPVALSACLSFSAISLGESRQLELPELGDERFGVEIAYDATYTTQSDDDPEREVSEALTLHAAYIRRANVIMLIQSIQTEADEFLRYAAEADEKLAELVGERELREASATEGITNILELAPFDFQRCSPRRIEFDLELDPRDLPPDGSSEVVAVEEWESCHFEVLAYLSEPLDEEFTGPLCEVRIVEDYGGDSGSTSIAPSSPGCDLVAFETSGP